jgi:hypothetical protein
VGSSRPFGDPLLLRVLRGGRRNWRRWTGGRYHLRDDAEGVRLQLRFGFSVATSRSRRCSPCWTTRAVPDVGGPTGWDARGKAHRSDLRRSRRARCMGSRPLRCCTDIRSAFQGRTLRRENPTHPLDAGEAAPRMRMAIGRNMARRCTVGNLTRVRLFGPAMAGKLRRRRIRFRLSVCASSKNRVEWYEAALAQSLLWP